MADFFGDDGNNRIDGDDTDDRLYGRGGSDLIYGRRGDDYISGGSGADRLIGNHGDDTIYAGPGDDEVYASVGVDVLYGGTGNDTLYVNADEGTAYGGIGNDTLVGGGSNINTITTGIIGGRDDGDTDLYGGVGDDTIYSMGRGQNIHDGGSGVDRLIIDRQADTTILDLLAMWRTDGGFADDQFVSIEHIVSNHTLAEAYGTNGDEIFENATGVDRVGGKSDIDFYGRGGDDVFIYTAYDNGRIAGGDGIDEARFEMSRDLVREGGLTIDLNRQTVDAGAASMGRITSVENVVGSVKGDYILGSHGENHLRGGDGHDRLTGRKGDDTLEGGEKDDYLNGGADNDTLNGGAGSDLLIGSTGDDTLTGGTEADVFRFRDGEGADAITDFEDGVDMIELYQVSLPPGGYTVDDVAGGALLDYGSGTILLEGISAALIDDDDIIFTA